MKKLWFLQLILLVAGLLLTGCKKKEIQGPKGDPGDPGAGGNTSVSSSTVMLISSAQWTPIANPNTWRADVKFSEISAEVVEKGGVSVYIKTDTGWRELPYLEGSHVTQFVFYNGRVQLQKFEVHSLLLDQPEAQYFRIVVLTQSARTTKPIQSFGQNVSVNRSE